VLPEAPEKKRSLAGDVTTGSVLEGGIERVGDPFGRRTVGREGQFAAL